GLVFAVIVVTRPVLVTDALGGSSDLIFLALVLWSAVLIAEARGPSAVVLGPMLAAGLLRPEAWLLSVAYVAYCWPATTGRRRRSLAGLALAAPVMWLGLDLVVTGHPLFSLTRTQDLAVQLVRAHSLSSAMAVLPRFLHDNLGGEVFWCGAAGALLTCGLAPVRAFIPAALILAGALGFLALGLARLPLLTRYALLPTLGLALFAAVLAAQRPSEGSGAPSRWAWRVARAATIGILLASAPSTARQLSNITTFFGRRAGAEADLRRLLYQPAVADRVCDQIVVASPFQVPLAAWWLRRPSSAVVVRSVPPLPGLYVVAADARTAGLLDFTGSAPAVATSSALPGSERLAATRHWRAFSLCRGKPIPTTGR
ncbi:MAG: hypothetical protein QOF55_2159, partial [Thermoleophilaceae bacterium]|nr:hypothetical protein [Thermoleophilaceae bacterium]